MKQYLIVAGFILAALTVVKYMMNRARTDSILSDLNSEEARKNAEAYAADVARATKEIEDAKIRYANARRKFDESAGQGTVSGTDEGV